ncbi:hypothetical protein POTOM_025139 [Populus tomentosa]|uniref:Uncharacterized protein n=1 Tax=Populus tomentosa TaxID=118781 RepID=A0A8X7ZIN0_POPTO|nr:hypothetical protein POTOM_025139 [Populus tomentosa]
MLNTVSLPFVYVVVSHKKANMVTNHEAFLLSMKQEVLLKFLLGSGNTLYTYRNFRDEKSLLDNNIPFHSLTKVC